jgi:DNA-binding response OmpR family regulator
LKNTEGQSRYYDFGEFRLDATERVLFKSNEPLNLPPKVFDTLLALVLKSGHIRAGVLQSSSENEPDETLILSKGKSCGL